MRPYAFIAAGGRAVWLKREGSGWAKLDPNNMLGDGPASHSANYLLEILCNIYENGGVPNKDTNYPERWGCRMTPVYPNENLVFKP